MKNRPFWAAFLTVCLLVAIGAGALCEAAAPVELQGTVTAIGADGSAIVDITMQALTEAGYELDVYKRQQRDAFARSYALINPSFKVESFAGYCDPTAVFGDIDPNDEITAERIETVRAHDKDTDYVRALTKAYADVEDLTGEVAFFMEQVTGHVIPDMRPAIKHGVNSMIARLEEALKTETDETKRSGFRAMRDALSCLSLIHIWYSQGALPAAAA